MSSEAAIYETIKSTVHALLPDCRILLFGSRARGEATKHSNYDLMVILPDEITKTERLSLSRQLHEAIVRAIRAPIDLLVYSEGEIGRNQQLPGQIVRTAVREGVAL